MMTSLDNLQDNILNDIIIYLNNYPELHADDLFALKTDLTQIIIDSIAEGKVNEEW